MPLPLDLLVDRQSSLNAIVGMSGLQAYYDALTASSLTYTAATGATSLMADLSGNSNTNVINFNGTKRCTVANIPTFGTGDFTVAFWITPQSVTGVQALCFGASNSFGPYLSGTSVVSSQPGVADYVTKTNAVSIGTRACLIYTRSGTTGTWYLNGASPTSGTDNGNYTAAVVCIGAQTTDTTPFIGNFENVLIYNRALSAGEVATLYATGVPSAADTTTPAAGTAILTGTASDFTVDNYWSKSAGTTIAAGTCTLSGTSDIHKTLLTVGQRYRATIVVSSYTSGNIFLGDGNGNGGSRTTSGSVEFTATATPFYCGYPGNPVSASITSITLTPVGLLLKPTLPLTRGATTIADTSGNSATITLPASGVWVSGARDLAQVVGASQPIYLPWSGTNYGWLPGVNGNYFSTPDSAAVSITGDIDIRVQASLANWQPAGAQVLVGKWKVTVGYSYLFYVNATGTLVFQTTANNSTSRTATSSVANAIAAGATSWVRVTRASATGNVNFYTSTDGSTWTQLGTQVSTTAEGIYDGASNVVIGVNEDSGSSLLVGSIYRAEIRNGIGGSIAALFNPAETTDGSSSWTASTGEVWTVNTSGGKPALIVGRPGVLFDGSAFYLKTAPFTLNQPTWVVFVGKQLTWTNQDKLFDGNAAALMTVYQNSTTPNLNMYAGVNVGENSGLALNTSGIITAVFNSTSSSSRINNGVPVSGNAGTANAGGFTLAAQGDGTTAFANIIVNAVAIFSVAPTAADIARVVQYFARRWSISV